MPRVYRVKPPPKGLGKARDHRCVEDGCENRADHWHHVLPDRLPSVVVPMCITCHHRAHVRMRLEARRAARAAPALVVVPEQPASPLFERPDRSEVFEWIDAMIELEALVTTDTAWLHEED